MSDNNKRWIGIVGDVHGKMKSYINLVKDIPYSVQVGDMGFYYNDLAKLEYDRHKFFPDNHDHHEHLSQEGVLPHYLGRYGNRELNGVKFFVVGGGHSIDQKFRTFGKDYWRNEELDGREIAECIRLYQEDKPDIVLSHECPTFISDIIGEPGILRDFGYDDGWHSYTAQLLTELYKIHKPKLWCFGHYHKRHDLYWEKTRFVCLEELGVVFITEDGEVSDLKHFLKERKAIKEKALAEHRAGKSKSTEEFVREIQDGA